jgi:hypothetical protein
MKRTLVTLVTVFGIAAANAATNNPLHPQYFAGQGDGLVTTAPYVSAGNPLHPSFSRDGAGWIATAAGSGTQSYMDAHNPLHPQFKRF